PSHPTLPSSPAFFFNDTTTTEIYTLSLHDALPIYQAAAAAVLDHHHDRDLRLECRREPGEPGVGARRVPVVHRAGLVGASLVAEDRKSTRLNSSHVEISYAVFCLKKKKKIYERHLS